MKEEQQGQRVKKKQRRKMKLKLKLKLKRSNNRRKGGKRNKIKECDEVRRQWCRKYEGCRESVIGVQLSVVGRWWIDVNQIYVVKPIYIYICMCVWCVCISCLNSIIINNSITKGIFILSFHPLPSPFQSNSSIVR